MRRFIVPILLFVISGCYSAGTLGGFKIINFPVSKRKLVIAIDSFYKLKPQYQMPEKWRDLDDWSARGYDFLDSRLFYFSSKPEEMYYVTFIGDGNDKVQADTSMTSISIRVIYNSDKRMLYQKDVNAIEEQRINYRFEKEIVSYLEKLTNSKSTYND